MSAWMTSRTHRSALTQAAVINQIIDFKEAGWLFNELTRCNRLALHHRYSDPHPSVLDDEHREVVEAPLDTNVLLRNITCWMYQCSEYDDFSKEPCVQVMDELENHLLQCLGYPPDSMGYDDWRDTIRKCNIDLPWGIETWDQVIDHAMTT